MRKIVFILLTLICALNASLISAKNLGAIGPVYPIAETDFLQWIRARMQEKIQNGEFTRWQEGQIAAIKSFADRPIPVAGLTPTQQTRRWLYDPTLTLTHDLLDAEGHVRFPAGTRLNPLTIVTWTKTLLFYNGDDPEQVAWVKKVNQQLQGQVLLILTQGSVSEQTKAHNQRVYFDQDGQLVQRFGITHIPARVAQAGNKLSITEVKL